MAAKFLLAALWLLLLFTLPTSDARCKRTENGKQYLLTIGLLTSTNFTVQATIQQNILFSGELRNCFSSPHYITLSVKDSLHIPSDGWTKIENGIKTALEKQGATAGIKPNLIIGPFYTNLAMMLERLDIPYIVTDYKGFDWIDSSRALDTTPWRTLVEMRPPVQQQNLAVVDYFRSEGWNSAVMLMPDNSADNQECQDLVRQMLGAGISLIPYTISSGDVRMVHEVLRNSRLFRMNYMVICSPRDLRDNLIELVLKQAKLFDMTSNEDQVFFMVDPSSYLKPMASVEAIYQLGLFAARCRLLAFRYVMPPAEGNTLDADTATAIDAARITTLALNNYISSQAEKSDVFSSERFMSELRNVSLLNGNTGVLKFSSSGQRIDYSLHLYNHGGEGMYKKIAEWSPTGDSPGTRLNLTGFEVGQTRTTQYGIFPRLVKIVVVLEEPFVMLRDLGDDNKLTGSNRFEGFTIDMIRRLAEELKFQYEIYISPNNAYGAKLQNGTWDGMVGEIMNGNATLAAGAISITSAREKVIDFSLGVLSTGVNILVRKPTESLTIFQFMKPFSLELWMAIVGASTFVSLVLFLMDYDSDVRRRFTLKETVWFCIGTLLKRGTDFAPVPVSQRIMTAGFTFFVLITVSTYTANMAAFLTTKNLGKSIDSFEDLATDNDMQCGTVRNSATMAFLEQGTKPLYQSLWKKVVQSSGLVANATEGRQRVRNGGFALIFDYLINSYSELKYCDTKSAATTILLQEHGIGMPAGAPYKTNINIVLLRMKETGYLQELKKKWWDNKRTCDEQDESTRSEQVEFGLEHMAGVFIVGILGLGAALALFLFKKFYLFIRPARKEGCNGGVTSSKQQLTLMAGREKEKLCQSNTSFV